jgi:hypothetical protein
VDPIQSTQRRNRNENQESTTRPLSLILVAALLFIPLATTRVAYASAGSPGAVYVLSNEAAGNQVIAFDRFVDGSLAEAGNTNRWSWYRQRLGSQGDRPEPDNRWLSLSTAATKSAFCRAVAGLVLADKVASGGDMPVSLTAYNNFSSS